MGKMNLKKALIVGGTIGALSGAAMAVATDNPQGKGELTECIADMAVGAALGTTLTYGLGKHKEDLDLLEQEALDELHQEEKNTEPALEK
jgi:uncharacterized membrane protein YeaQ/YmgE (transglycosylase-associated protein family)